MKSLLCYLKDYKKESIFAPLFKMLEALFELFVPLVMAAIIDRGIAHSDYAEIGRLGAILIALGIIGLISSITAQFFAAKAAVGFATTLRHSLFEHLQNLSFKEIDSLGTSTMITRMTSDVNQVQNGVNMVLRLFLRSPFIVFGAMIMAFTINAKAAFVFVVTIPALAVVVIGITAMTIPLYKKVQEKLDGVLSSTRENLTGARVIRAFAREKEEKRDFDKKTQELNRLQLHVGGISTLTNPVTFVIVNAATMVLLYTGAVQVNQGFITQGEVVALVNYMSQILVELVKLANLIITITKSLACAQRLEAVLNISSSMNIHKITENRELTRNITEDVTHVSENIISFQNVTLSYNLTGDAALDECGFTIKRGSTVGIIGGTGSGKSSIVNLIPRFYDVTKGAVLVSDCNVKEYDMNELRSKIGIVMQKAVLFHGTIEENLRWGNENATKEDLITALKTAQAWEFVQQKEDGIKFMIAQGGRNLSGGQRQRLTIARALVRKPEILILDDSASALDFATDAALRHAIASLQGGQTVIIVSQRASSIMQADQILVLDDGRLVGNGTHEELLDSCAVYQEIYESQFPREREAVR